MKKIGLILGVFAFLVYCASDGQSQEVSPKVGDNARRMLPSFFMLNMVDRLALSSSVGCKNKSLRSKNLMSK
jgi:hypothetical protein